MVIVEYIYYRMFKAYEKKNDSPHIRTFMYVTLLLFYSVCAVAIYLEGILEKAGVINSVSKETKQIFLLTTGLFVLVYTYWFYSRKNPDYYESRFGSHVQLNRRIKVWMLIVLPFLLFLGSIHLYVVLFGGQILGEQVRGILND
jgi:hypothetical protein